jgi:hypothetical protein
MEQIEPRAPACRIAPRDIRQTEPVNTVAASGPVLAIAYLAFFLSGGAGLILEISWSRQIGLLFGHTAQAATVVLCSYFTGMAVGCLVGARWARLTRPLVGYAACELVAAGWACAVPAMLRLAESPAIAFWLNNPAFVLQATARAVFCFVLLLPATIALGATLPLLAEFFFSTSRRGQSAGAESRFTGLRAEHAGRASGRFVRLVLSVAGRGRCRQQLLGGKPLAGLRTPGQRTLLLGPALDHRGTSGK